jgi:hypothetical protein
VEFRGKIGQTSHFRGFQDSLVGFSAEVLGVTRQDPDFPKGQKLQPKNELGIIYYFYNQKTENADPFQLL